MSTNPSGDSADETDYHGEILKASAPGASQLELGMSVTTLDGNEIGTVKTIHKDEFLLNRPLARDLWVPFAVVLSLEDYNSNFRRGPARKPSVVLNLTEAHVDLQGWRHG